MAAQRIVCPDCGAAHAVCTARSGETLRCVRCDAVLARGHRLTAQGRAALVLACAVCYLIAMLNPIVTVRLSGRQAVATLPSAIGATWQQGEHLVALVAAFTAVVAPAALIGAHAAALMGGGVARWMHRIEDWSMVEVLLVGALVALVRVADLAGASPGPGLFAFGALMVLLASIESATDVPHLHASARDARLSLQRTAALLVAAAVLFVPANVLPIMATQSIAGRSAHTIAGGVLELWDSGSWGLALIVFIASLVVPILKIVVLALLAWTSRRPSAWRRRERARLYRAVEAVGHWSMLDVYVVVLLVAFVPFGSLAQVLAAPGLLAFAAVVVLTMLAAQQFDARLIWQDAPRDD